MTTAADYSEALRYTARLPRSPRPVKPAEVLRPTISPRLQGTKLAADLIRIRDRYGHSDSRLRQLAERALGGNAGTPVYEAIRDRLSSHADPLADHRFSQRDPLGSAKDYQQEAQRLSREYNWHRIQPQLDLDDVVKEYVDSIAKSHVRGQHLRLAHNLFGEGWQKRSKPVTAEQHTAFWSGLRSHIRKRALGPNSAYGLTAADTTDHLLRKSLRRLGENEEAAEKLPQQKQAPAEADGAAYATTIDGKLKPLPTAKARQYSRYVLALSSVYVSGEQNRELKQHIPI